MCNSEPCLDEEETHVVVTKEGANLNFEAYCLVPSGFPPGHCFTCNTNPCQAKTVAKAIKKVREKTKKPVTKKGKKPPKPKKKGKGKN
jgi:hypothetical protein